MMRSARDEACCPAQAAPAPPPPPVAPTPLVAQPPEDPMGLADVVGTAAPGWYIILDHLKIRTAHPSVSAERLLQTLLCYIHH